MRRRRTPSTIKDLIEVRARADGEIIRYKALIGELTAAMRQAKKDRDAADRMLNRVEKRIPTATIKPIAPRTKYARGELTGTLQQLLREASPDSMSSREIALCAGVKLGVTFATPKEQQDWVQNNLLREMRELVRRGLVERLHKKKFNGADGRWRWRSDAAPSVDHLRAQVEAEGEEVQQTDASLE